MIEITIKLFSYLFLKIDIITCSKTSLVNMKGLCTFTVCLLLSVSGCLSASLGSSVCVGHTVFCFVDPCMVSRCTYPGAHCVSNYCGGCHAFWYDGHVRLSTEQCAGSTENHSTTMAALIPPF